LSKKTLKEQNTLEDVDYTLNNISKVKIIGVAAALFFSAFLINYPFIGIVKSKIKSTLSRLPGGCSITMKDIEFGIFLPKIILNNVNISARCTGNPQSTQLSHLNIYFRGPSFSPLGISTKIETEFQGIPLEVYASLGPKEQAFKIEEMNLPLKKLAKVSKGLQLGGDVTIDALIKIKSNSLKSINAKVESKNFMIPSQSFEGFDIPSLDIKSLSLKVSQKTPNKILLDHLIIGNSNSPLRANFLNGNLKPNSIKFLNSRLEFKGDLAIKNKILDKDEYFILKDYLNKFPKRDEFYQLKIMGNIGHPVIEAL
jgi:hypothetical protein